MATDADLANAREQISDLQGQLSDLHQQIAESESISSARETPAARVLVAPTPPAADPLAALAKAQPRFIDTPAPKLTPLIAATPNDGLATRWATAPIRRPYNPPFPPDDATVTESTTTATSVFPFQVTQSESGINIYPGVVENNVATLYGAPLTSIPAPSTNPPNGTSNVWLRTHVITDPTDSYRYKTDLVDIRVYALGEEPPDEPAEWIIKWDDAYRNAGHFWVRLAQLDTSFADGVTTMVIQQFVFNSFRTLAFIGMQVLPLA